MIPTIKLGPWDSPDFEIMPDDLYPILAIMLELEPEPSSDAYYGVLTLLQLDTLFLHAETEGFFSRFEDVCRRVLEGQLTEYSPATLAGSDELNWHIKPGCVGDGVVTPSVKDVASRFLGFLAANPDYWPFKGEAQGSA